MDEIIGRETLRVALIGASGAMGREIARLAPTRNAEIVLRFNSGNPLPEERPDVPCDVAIDFTLPDAVIGNVTRLAAWGVPVVVGTTGWYSHLDDVRSIVGESRGRLIWDGNFSVGVQAFFALARRAAEIFDRLEEYDVALHEEHHVRKADSPSGTALRIADILLEGISRKTGVLSETAHERIAADALHVTSRRIGSTVGLHTVTFDSEADTIELVHRAKNRSGFALGALTAARMILDLPPGLYRFGDLLQTAWNGGKDDPA